MRHYHLDRCPRILYWSSTGLWGRPFEKLGKRCQQMPNRGTHFFCLPTDKLLFIRSSLFRPQPLPSRART
ncbi:MAG: hypothetical protein EZS28_034575, partial [Streblomastix strix]